MALVKRIFKIKKDIDWSFWFYADLRDRPHSHRIYLTFMVLKVGIFFNNRLPNIIPSSEWKYKSRYQTIPAFIFPLRRESDRITFMQNPKAESCLFLAKKYHNKNIRAPPSNML